MACAQHGQSDGGAVPPIASFAAREPSCGGRRLIAPWPAENGGKLLCGDDQYFAISNLVYIACMCVEFGRDNITSCRWSMG